MDGLSPPYFIWRQNGLSDLGEEQLEQDLQHEVHVLQRQHVPLFQPQLQKELSFVSYDYPRDQKRANHGKAHTSRLE